MLKSLNNLIEVKYYRYSQNGQILSLYSLLWMKNMSTVKKVLIEFNKEVTYEYILSKQ